MKNKKIIIISIIALTILAIFAYIFITNKVDCREYSYDKCPDGCIVSSSRPGTADIGCFPKNHQDNWPK